ncbi:hypothetical protein ACJIZ3_011372 [Penstemon smallii]|uniref:Uncharacterized protein n=1 Tax=Penstemon smallii TaxID=265156 RepID=A0ABD3UMH5_9LAMI
MENNLKSQNPFYFLSLHSRKKRGREEKERGRAESEDRRKKERKEEEKKIWFFPKSP